MGSFITKVKPEDMIGYTIKDINIMRNSDLVWMGDFTMYDDGEICINTNDHSKDIYATFKCKIAGDYGRFDLVSDEENKSIEVEEIRDLKITNIERVVVKEELILGVMVKDYEYYKVTDQDNFVYRFYVTEFFTYDEEKYIRNEI